MTSAIIQYKNQEIKVFLTPLQWRIVKMLEKYPKGLTRGLYNERGSLMKRLNKARTTIYDNLVKLQRMGIVENYTRNDGTEGRPKKYWKLTERGDFK